MYIGGIPIVSLDRVYLEPDDSNIYFLDCTRLDGSSEVVSRLNPNESDSVKKQIFALSEKFRENKNTSIVLADDVVFSGSVLRNIIAEFNKNNIQVVGIRACVCTNSSFEYFNSLLKEGIKCGCLLGEDVVDQICERDFYFGIAQSGISVKKGDPIYKAPYFKPFGNPVERASIPKKFEEYFSSGCIIRSLALWDRVEKLTGREILIKDLPENILNTESNNGVVKVLKNTLRNRNINNIER